MNLQEIYLEIRPEDIAYIKFILESYEGVGMIRTVNRSKAVIVLLVVDDFSPIARDLLASLKKEVPLKEIARPNDGGEDWFLNEIAVESLPK
jgi:hypothetical protein